MGGGDGDKNGKTQSHNNNLSRSLLELRAQDIQNAVREEFAKGTNAFEIFTKVRLPQYEDLYQYDNWFPQNVQAMVVNEVLGPLSWREDRGGKALESDTRSAAAEAKPPPSKCYWRFKKKTRRFGRSVEF